VLHDWELTSLRSSAQDVMPDTCDVYRRAAGPDNYGGGGAFGDTPAVEGAKVQVEPIEGGAATGFAGRESDGTQFELAFPYGTDVRSGDMVVVTSLDDVQIIIRAVEEPESWDVLVSAQGTLAE
jgi:hypothetical protein